MDLWIGPCTTYPVKTTLVHRRVNVNCKCECVQYIVPVLLVPSSTEVVRTADGTTDPTQGFPICFRLSCDVRLRSWRSCPHVTTHVTQSVLPHAWQMKRENFLMSPRLLPTMEHCTWPIRYLSLVPLLVPEYVPVVNVPDIYVPEYVAVI